MRNASIQAGPISLPSTFFVGIRHERKAMLSRTATLTSLTSSGLGLSGVRGSVFLPQEGRSAKARDRHVIARKPGGRMFIL